MSITDANQSKAGSDETTSVVVIGVGSMSRHHACIYDPLPDIDLDGVVSKDVLKPREFAEQYSTRAKSTVELLDIVAAVSIAVPTKYHHDIAKRSLAGDVDILEEKLFIRRHTAGRELVEFADRRDEILQVGHIERFDPVIQTLKDIFGGLTVIAIQAERLGPSQDRTIEDSAVMDLKIRDVDIVLSSLEEPPDSVLGAGVRNNRHATAILTFKSGGIAELTASRLVQKRGRTLAVTAEERPMRIGFTDRSIIIHTAPTPSYTRDDENVRFRHGNVIERPMIESTEPLRNELESFKEAVRVRSTPPVCSNEGLDALKIAKQIEEFGEIGSKWIARQRPRKSRRIRAGDLPVESDTEYACL